MSNPGVPGRPRPGAADRTAPASPQAPARPGPAVAAGQPSRPYPAVSDNGQRSNGSGSGDSPTETLPRVTASAPPAAATAGAPPAGATRAGAVSTSGTTTGHGLAGATADGTAEWRRPAYGSSVPASVSAYAPASAAAAASAAETATAGATAAHEEGPRTRRARLKITRVDPWSVMKLAFLLSIAVGIVLVVAVFVIWSVLDSVGVFSSIQATVSDVTGEEGTFDIVGFVALDRVIGFTTLLSIANVVLLTALATLGAFLYNLVATFAGGLEVTLSDGD